MKKMCLVLVLGFMLVFSCGAMAATVTGDLTMKIGFDLMGNHNVDFMGMEEDIDVKNGMSFSAEYTLPVLDSLAAGVGASLQMPRGFEDYIGKFNFTPVYGLVKMDLDPIYLVSHLGYNLFSGDTSYTGLGVDLKGGLYYGFGAGIKLTDEFIVEALYTTNNGTLEVDFLEVDVKYSKVTIATGYQF